jgi:hypothetical protein
METIPKERLHRIGIQTDISITNKPSSIIIPVLVVAAALIIYLFLHIGHHSIVAPALSCMRAIPSRG